MDRSEGYYYPIIGGFVFSIYTYIINVQITWQHSHVALCAPQETPPSPPPDPTPFPRKDQITITLVLHIIMMSLSSCCLMRSPSRRDAELLSLSGEDGRSWMDKSLQSIGHRQRWKLGGGACYRGRRNLRLRLLLLLLQ